MESLIIFICSVYHVGYVGCWDTFCSSVMQMECCQDEGSLLAMGHAYNCCNANRGHGIYRPTLMKRAKDKLHGESQVEIWSSDCVT